jgi:hypothetical protein
MIATGTFTTDAKVFANGRNLKLINGSKFSKVRHAPSGSRPTHLQTNGNGIKQENRLARCAAR